MRYPGAIVLSLLTCGLVMADEAGILEWSAARRLSWDDFSGSIPSGTDENRVAATNASLAWSYEYRLEWSRDRCVFSIVNVNTFARFHKEGSWVRPGHRTDAVLQHEQGHFDLTKVYKEKFAARTRDFIGSERTCRGRNDRAATRWAETEIAQLVGSIYDDIWRQYRQQQESYDAETRHGIDSVAQAAWSEEIAALLNSTILR